MELSALTLRVLLLFFPGVLCAMLVDALTREPDRSPSRFLTSSFVLGMSSYVLLYGLRELCAVGADLFRLSAPPRMTFFAALLDEKQRIASGEIIFSALIAVPLAITVSAVVNHNFLVRTARRLKVARGSAESDVWSFLFNSPDLQWILVRDLVHDLAFRGLVEAFSEAGDRPQLLLSEVSVYRNSSGAKLYDASRLYFSRPGEALLLEPVTEATTPLAGADNAGTEGAAPAAGLVQEGRHQSAADDAASTGRPSAADGDSVPDAG